MTVTRLMSEAKSEKDIAVKIFRFVRDIKFGFASNFYSQTADEVISQNRGFCVTKSKLFVAMLQQAGIQAEMHYAILHKDILRGFLGRGPPGLDHGFTRVKLNGQWMSVDAYTVDPMLYSAAKERLIEENATMGYGIHRDGVNDWNGEDDALVQMRGEAVLKKDLGAFTSNEELYRSEFKHDTCNERGWIESLIMPVLFPWVVNPTIESFRQSAP